MGSKDESISTAIGLVNVTESKNQRTVGTAILAILTAQAGLLALFLSGSVLLQTTSNASTMEWGFKGLMMLLVGLAYLVLAYGLWSLQSWTRVYSFATLAVVLAAGIINTMDDKLLDLGFVLVFFMCCAVNFVITAWFLLSGVQEKPVK